MHCLRGIWKPGTNIEVVDPFLVITGLGMLNDFIADFQSKQSGYQFNPLNAVNTHNYIAKLSWQYRPPDKLNTITGQDIFVSANSRIERPFIFINGMNNIDPAWHL